MSRQACFGAAAGSADSARMATVNASTLMATLPTDGGQFTKRKPEYKPKPPSRPAYSQTAGLPPRQRCLTAGECPLTLRARRTFCLRTDPHMAASPLPRLRLDSEVRRRRIVDAALPLFARQGFAGTTTKEIAEAAEVSEALLFKHFPTKAALYGAIQDFGCRIKEEALERLRMLEPSTSGLVLMAYMMVHHIVRGDADDQLNGDTRHRLIANSLLADGEYARLVYETVFAQVFPKFGACLEAAEAAGDLVAVPVQHENRFWFGQPVAATMALVSLPGKPAVPYRG